MPKKNNTIAEINPQAFKELIYQFRGQQVMLDSDLATIYGYETRDFNNQVKHNIEKFDEDFMFQLSKEEIEILKWKKSTSSWGGRRSVPNVFTEQGIYMLMTVLKGPLATTQSKALIRTFKQMKDHIVQNQPLLGQREYMQLSLQTSENTRDIIEVRNSLSEIDEKVANIVDSLGEVVTKSQLANVMLDFGEPSVRRGWLILNGQPVESDLAYHQIYSEAKKSIYLIDNYLGLKTLALLKDVPSSVEIQIISDNIQGKLHKAEYNDFLTEYPTINILLRSAGSVFHDRYIVLDYDTTNEKIYHCGASSKDGGSKVTTITLVTDAKIYHSLIDKTLINPILILR